jgi:hypothetical protein
MIFRKHHAAFGALEFFCTVLAAMAPAALRAEADDGSMRQLIPVSAGQSRQAQAAEAGETMTVPLSSTDIVPAQYNGDVRDLPQISYPTYYHFLNEFTPPPIRRPPPGTQLQPVPESPFTPPPSLAAQMPAPTKNFAGLSFTSNLGGHTAGAGWPPDTNGDVGPTVYIEAVNDAWGIFDKSTGTLTAGFTENQLWSGAGTGTPCDANNFGDPIAMHDGLADRWILTNFAFTLDGSGNPQAPFYQCFAVSKTSDPVAGGWYLYAVHMDNGGTGAPPVGTFADYPKLGLWTDCLYLGANGFDNNSGAYAGAVFAAFDRTTLYSGAALTSSNSSIGFVNDSNVFGNFPANLNGTVAAAQPPAGRPEFFVAESATAFNFDVRKFQKGATACGSGSTLSSPTHVTQASYGVPLIPASGGGYTADMVRQPGTTNVLDSLGDEIMQRVVYRKVGSAESLWVVHTTCGSGSDVNGACATSTTSTRPQWAQINVSGGTISATPVQQQIYAPDSTLYRWMGSLAVDNQGNMALGYSTSNGTSPNFPSLAYSGRLVGDTANTLPQTERQLVAGAASQNKCGVTPCSRWGDYSAMTIDPSDDCTFWYTNLYYASAANATNGHWDTRIGSFKFPGCTGVAATKLVFTVEPNASYASNASINVSVSVEDAAGDVVVGNTSAVTIALQGGNAGATLGGTATVNAVNGVATFTLSVDLVGSAYKLHATDGSLTAADSTTFNITPGPASKLAFTTQPPASTPAGTNFSAVVKVQDAAGNTVTTDNSAVTLALTCACATVGGNVVSASSGVATFSAINITKAGTSYQLKATDSSLTNATSNAFTITAAAPASVALTTQPATSSNVAAGATIPLVAQVKDSFNNVVAGDNVTLAIGTNPGGATLSVTSNPVATDSSGNATFAGVSLDKAGTGYTLKVTEGTNAHTATSNAFNIVGGAAASITFVTQPAPFSNVAAGATIPTVAQVKDSFGNSVAGDNVTLDLGSNPGGSTLSVTTNPVATDGGGNATFAGVSLDKIGSNYSLKVTESANAHSTTSNAFNIVAGAPNSITLTTQPGVNSDVTAAATIPLVAQVTDSFGNVVAGDNVTLAIGTNAGGGTLSVTGNPVATNSSGNATFSGVALDKIGTGYTLQASESIGSLAITSNAFNIVLGGPAQLVFTTQPTDVVQGNTLNTIAVSETDAGGNAITTDSVTSVDFTASACGTSLGSATMNSGVATLSSAQVFNTLRAGLTVSANDLSLSISGLSQPFNVGPNDLLFTDGFEACTP